jgi:quinol monooxygenase YgiN
MVSMSFLVVVRMQARSERLADVLALVQREFGRPPSQRIGRRRGRLFQRLTTPTDLLEFSEWDSQEAYGLDRSSATHRAVLDSLEGASHARYCGRLVSFERALERSEVTTAILIDCPPAAGPRIEGFMLGEGRKALRDSVGLVSYEIYRTHKRPPSYIVVHQWRLLADLERFRVEAGTGHEAVLVDLGATIERFTGRLTAEYPAE